MAQRRGFSSSSGEPPDGAPAKTSSGGIVGASGRASAYTSNVDDFAYVPRWTSGRECWVFHAEDPDELCGYHPQLIASALGSNESFHYLLYSPIFDARDGPFRVGGAPASHAVGITARRFLISRDLHSDAGMRSVTRIDLAAVSSLQIGCALALGWFVVRYSGPQGAGSYPVLFSGLGMRHFRALVRAYRRLGEEEDGADETALDWPAVWEGVPPYLRTELEPLIEPGERPGAVLRSHERWTTEKRLWRSRPVCVSAPGLLIATSRGLLWGGSEPRMTPAGLSFGVNVTAVRPTRVLDAAIGTRGTVGVLRVHAGDRPDPHELEVPFDGADVAAAEQIVRVARAWRGRV